MQAEHLEDIQLEIDYLGQIIDLKHEITSHNRLLVNIAEVCRDKGYVNLETLKILIKEHIIN